MLIIVCGLPGTGKTTLANYLSSEFGGRILRTDQIRRELFRTARLDEVLESDDPMRYDLERIFDRQESIPERYQRMIWRQKESVYAELLRRVGKLLKEGYNVILDGTFYKRRLREEAYAAALKAGVKAYTVECRCPEEVVRERLNRRAGSADELSNVKKMEIYETVKSVYESPVSDPVPVILYDTSSGAVETRNFDTGDEQSLALLRSIERLAHEV
ncbi:MAG: kinase [Candidatus Bathyarchaeota archaeon B63]|nr:MAG: kinase [Candidatus Bathyarchaeota archaeon B63]